MRFRVVSLFWLLAAASPLTAAEGVSADAGLRCPVIAAGTVRDPVRVLDEAARTGSVTCVRHVLGNIDRPGEAAAGALANVRQWRGKVSFAPVIEELLTKVSFKDKRSRAHRVLLGLVYQQEYGLLEKVLRLGANPNVNERHDLRGQGPINIAAYYGDHKAIEILLKHGADVNYRGTRGQSALFAAIDRQLRPTVEFLLKNGADPELKDRNGLTPYLCACAGGCGNADPVQRNGAAFAAAERVRLEIERTLLAAIKDKSQVKFCNPRSIRAGRLLLHSPNLKYLDAMLAKDKPLLNLYTDGGWTPLYSAVYENPDAALRLIEAGADVNIATMDGTTPLHGAVEKGDIRLVSALLRAGANPDAIDKSGNTPLSIAKSAEIVELLNGGSRKLVRTGGLKALFAAMQRDDVQLVSALLERGAPLRGCGPQGYSLLGYALLSNDTRVFRMLLSKGADIHESCAETTSLLVHAIESIRHENRKERHELVMELIERGGADLNRPSKGARASTPLMASIGRDKELTNYLLEHGAAVDVILPNGATALGRAAKLYDEALILRLLDRGADPTKYGGEYGPPLLDVAFRSAKVVESMLVYGAPAEVSDREGRSALQLALGAGLGWGGPRTPMNPRPAIKLLEHGANPHTSSGLLPLAVAVRNYHVSDEWKSLFRELIRRGAVPVRRKGYYPLHHAVSIKQVGVLSALIAAGERPTAKDQDGKTAFDVARAVGCGECDGLLREGRRR